MGCRLTNIPASVAVIGENAFDGCDIPTITIPETVTTIEKRAFATSNIQTVVLPDSITQMG